jgi:general secretion pathway protein F
MEAFHYQALNSAGRLVSGVVEADTARLARVQLRAQGLMPSTIHQVQARERARQVWARGISSGELSLVTRQMAILLESGLTMEQSLNALIEEATEPMTREILTGVKTEVISGLSLAGALAVYEKSFPDFYRALVHGGEESGALAMVLQHLADYLDARQALSQKTSLALLYPILVTIIAVLIVGGLLVFVVPQVVQVFQQSRQTLPLLTRALVSFSNFLRTAWPVLATFVIAATVAARMALRRDSVKYRWHGILLQVPWIGSLVRGVNTLRFANTLAILVRGGVPLLAALHSGAEVVTNRVMKAAIARAIERVREGVSLARALGETGVFPPMLIHLVASGEASGKVEQMLERVARLETQTLERRLAVFLTLLEPVMILVMGGVVLLIVLAILLPIIEINQLVH